MTLKNYYKTFLVLITIFVLCFLPGNTANEISFFDFPFFDKIVHFGMYFVFSLVLFSDLKTDTELQKKQIFPIILLLSFIIGGTIELVQNYFIPMRSGDWFDLLADLVGSFAFLFFILLKSNISEKQKNRKKLSA